MAEIRCQPLARQSTAVDLRKKTAAVATRTSSGPVKIKFFDIEQPAVVIRVIPLDHPLTSMFWVGEEELLLTQTVDSKPKVQIVTTTGEIKVTFDTRDGAEDDNNYNIYIDNNINIWMDDARHVTWCDGTHFVLTSHQRVKLFHLNQETPVFSWRFPGRFPSPSVQFSSFNGVNLVSCGFRDTYILDFLPGQPAVFLQ